MSAINVCGVLVHAQPEYLADVQAQLEAESGVEVHSVTEDGRMIVTIEKDTQEQTGEALNALVGMDKILSASPVYQYFDENYEQETQQ